MKSNVSKFITGSLAAVFMLFASQSVALAQVTNQNQNQNQNSQDQTVVEVIQNSNEHTIFLSLLEESGKLQELRDAQNVTVIAPTDRAFENMDKDVNELRQDPQKLEEFISNHIKENGMGANNTGINNQQDNERTRQDNNQNRSATGQDKQVIQASNGEVHVVQEVKNADKNKDNRQNENQDEDWK